MLKLELSESEADYREALKWKESLMRDVLERLELLQPGG